MGSCYLLSLPMALTLAGAKQESLARAALSNCRDRTAQPRTLDDGVKNSGEQQFLDEHIKVIGVEGLQS